MGLAGLFTRVTEFPPRPVYSEFSVGIITSSIDRISCFDCPGSLITVFKYVSKEKCIEN